MYNLLPIGCNQEDLAKLPYPVPFGPPFPELGEPRQECFQCTFGSSCYRVCTAESADQSLKQPGVPLNLSKALHTIGGQVLRIRTLRFYRPHLGFLSLLHFQRGADQFA
jgi:hypothetical protein